MKTVACYKWILDEKCMSVNSQTGSIDIREPVYEISPYDRNAIEAAVQCAEKTNGLCVTLSAGTDILQKSRKDVLSCGPKEGFAVIDPIMDQADCMVAANVVAAAVNKIGGVDLVICSEAASDTFAQQMAPRLGKQLGWPVVTYVSDIEIGDGRILVSRENETNVEKVEVPLPAVISVIGDCNIPRMPKLKDVMNAGKKPFTEWKAADLRLSEKELSAGIRTLSVTGNSTARKKIVIDGGGMEASMQKLLKCMIDEGVVS